MRRSCRQSTQISRNENVNDRQAGLAPSAAGSSRPRASAPASSALATAGHAYDNRALVRRIAVVNEAHQRL